MSHSFIRNWLILLLCLVVLPFGLGCPSAGGGGGGGLYGSSGGSSGGGGGGGGEGEGEGEGEGDELLVPAQASFSATLGGENEVAGEPVVSEATGSATFELVEVGVELAYTLTVTNGVGITQAHIHLGGPEENGDVVAFLFGLAEPGVEADGELASGNLTGEDLVGPLAGMPFSALLEAMMEGNAYVNVHSEANPAGEIRGQIVLTDDEMVVDGDAKCTDLTYENFASDFFASNCTRCHSSELSGFDRTGAPEGRNWDDLETVRDFATQIRERATESKDMPPSDPRPTDEDRARLQEWLDCETPSEEDQ